MKVRTAKKILNRWSRDFPRDMQPRQAHWDGLLPWTWGQWTEAHRVWCKAVAKGRISLRSSGDSKEEP